MRTRANTTESTSATPSDAARGGLRVLVVAAGALGIAMASLSMAASQPKLVWNFSPSVPVGLYGVDLRDWRRGDLVALKPAGQAEAVLSTVSALKPGRLLIKTIAGVPGDIVCQRAGAVAINGKHAARARILSPRGWPLLTTEGCNVIRPGDVFLLGDHPASLDSRYFGPVSASGVIGVLDPVWLPSLPVANQERQEQAATVSLPASAAVRP